MGGSVRWALVLGVAAALAAPPVAHASGHAPAGWLGVRAASLAAPGDPDTSFGGDGKQTLNFGGLDRASHVAITPDGRIVAIGATDATGAGDYAVARVLSDGTPDASFDGDGKKTIGTQAGVNDLGGGVVVLDDERIVVTGQGNATSDFVTQRLNAGGGLDTTFAGAGAGTSVVDFGGIDGANDMVRQSDGKLVIVGSTSSVGGGDFAIARLNADGTPDTSFSGDGKQTVGFGGDDVALGVAIAPGGKIVVAGQGGVGNDMVVTRLNANGSLDTTFSPSSPGAAYVDFGGTDSAGDVAVQPDGKIVLAGSTSAVALRRLRRRPARLERRPGPGVQRRREADGRLRRPERAGPGRHDPAERQDRPAWVRETPTATSSSSASGPTAASTRASAPAERSRSTSAAPSSTATSSSSRTGRSCWRAPRT